MHKKIDKTVKRCYSNIRKQHKGVPYRFLFGMGMPAIFYSVTVFDRDKELLSVGDRQLFLFAVHKKDVTVQRA